LRRFAVRAALALAFFFIAFPQGTDFGFETALRPTLILTPPASSALKKACSFAPRQDSPLSLPC
jgi:hypothetical protein